MPSVLQHTFKRNQVEQAIARIESNLGTPEVVVRANLKRLLDSDRKPRAAHLPWVEKAFAFYDEDRPGNGAEIAYRPYHAFALQTGVRLLKGGIPQSRTLLLLRQLRSELELCFAKLASQQPWALRPDIVDQVRLAQLVRDGFLLQAAPSMTFLVVQAGPEAEPIHLSGDPGEPVSGHVCSLAELTERLTFFSHQGQAAVVIEITNAIHQLLDILPRMQVRKRGRQ